MSINIVLFEPEIPPNTGNVSRLCAASNTVLHLIEPLGFSLADKYLKRAGLDYWQFLKLEVHPDWSSLCYKYGQARHFFASTKGHKNYAEIDFQEGDFIIFGPETRGLPQSILDLNRENNIRIPILSETRSLNLSSSVAIVLYEALRQLNFPHFN